MIHMFFVFKIFVIIVDDFHMYFQIRLMNMSYEATIKFNLQPDILNKNML